MSQLFNRDVVPGANKFTGDISQWDVSSVTDMNHIFHYASSFNGDISKWEVSKVTKMSFMFWGASSFNQTLCGKWATSTANRDRMFDGSAGKLCTAISKSTSIKALTLALNNDNPVES